ncbi:hypothetical protein ACC665_29385 [Rhizobium ruizarguesonis]
MPLLAAEFQELMSELSYDVLTHRTSMAVWRELHRFLQERPDLPKVRCIADLNELHGKAFKHWLYDRGLAQNTYRRLKLIVDAYFLRKFGRPSAFPARDKDHRKDIPEPDLRGLQRLTLVLRHEARMQKAMCLEGEALADAGSDPRGVTGAWSHEANQAWLVRHLAGNVLLDRHQLQKQNGNKLYDQSVGGPTYLSPTQSPQAAAGYVGKLRWFHPAKADTATFLWLFMLHTGFNLASALDIDVSDAGPAWWQPSLQHGDHCVIAVFKERAGKWVFRPSKMKPEYHAFGIMNYMIERTSGLRATAMVRLEELEEHNRKHPTNTVAAEIGYLRKAVKSPWLYHSLGRAGKVEIFESSDSGFLNSFVRDVAKSHGLLDDHPYLATLVTTQSRDGMINFTHKRTGEAHLTALAAQHPDTSSLRYYLARSADRKRNFKTVNDLIGYVINDVREREIFDPTRIKIIRMRGEITAEQEARLTDLRQRTRLGMGCRNPLAPPKTIAPHHVAGEVCREQRCTGCEHGVVFPESVMPLAYTLADLHFEKRNYPLASWKGSSLEDEEKSIRETLSLFDPQLVRQHYQQRMDELLSGNVRSFHVYPSY